MLHHIVYIQKNEVIRKPIHFDIKILSHCVNVILKFQEIILNDSEAAIHVEEKLKFMKLSNQAKAPVCTTQGSVGYCQFTAVYKSFLLQTFEAVATDITLVLPWGLYPRVAPHSSMVLKNTNIGAGMIDLDYRGNLKVVIMNHNVDDHLPIEPGDRIPQFILMRLETPKVVEMTDVNATKRGSGGFGSTSK